MRPMQSWTRRDILKTAAAGGTLALYGASALAQSGAAALARAPKQALVIGNSRYGHEPLKNPENDAKDMANVLQRAAFAVNLQLDVSRTSAQEAIAKFTEGLAKSKAVGVFYYAGHGAQLAWRNYLIPVDARIENVEQLRERCVDLNTIIEGIAKAGNPMNVLILDACRDNPFGSMRTEQKGLSQIDAPPGTLLAYATAPGNTASDGDGANGLYTEHLLKEILVPDAKIEDVFKRVRLGVRRRSGGKQIPWESTSLEEDFWFLPPLPLRQLLEQERDRVYKEQQAAWEKIKGTESPQPLQDFLQRYPGGPFTEQATARLQLLVTRERDQAELKRKQAEAERDQRHRERVAAWEKAKASDSPQVLEDFLRRYPGSTLSAEAQARLEELLSNQREEQARIRKQIEEERENARREQQAAWDKVRDSTKIETLAEFVRRYPDSDYARPAQTRIEQLISARQREEEERQRVYREQLPAWEAVREASAPEPLQEFIRRYPAGPFTEQARTRLNFIVARQKEVRELSQREREAQKDREYREQAAQWERLQTSTSAEALEDFLRRYPSGLFAELAQARLEQLLAIRGEQRIQAVFDKDNPYSKGSVLRSTAYKVGDSYTYRETDLFTRIATDITSTIREITEGQVIFDGGLITDLSGNNLRLTDGRLLSANQSFPIELAVGRKWSARFTMTVPMGSGEAKMDFRIVTREIVIVPAGKFDAYRVEGRGWAGFAHGTAYVEQNVWFAPDQVRRPVIFTDYRKHRSNVIANSRSELVAYREQ